MTKKAPPVATRHVIRFRWKVVIVFSVALCLLALLRLHSQPDPLSISRSRSRISRDNVFSGPPKIAFLFLVRRNLPLDFLWATFFEVFFFLFLNFLRKIFLRLILIFCLIFFFKFWLQNADTANFSIYIHSAPGFVFDESTTRSHYFHGRQLRNSIQVTMVFASQKMKEK